MDEDRQPMNVHVLYGKGGKQRGMQHLKEDTNNVEVEDDDCRPLILYDLL